MGVYIGCIFICMALSGTMLLVDRTLDRIATALEKIADRK